MNRLTRVDNRLALMDQAFYAGHRAAGQNEVMQVVWVYDRPVDIAGVKRFHRNLANGPLGRRIERSPLPFGRYRWVTDDRPPELDFPEQRRPRADLADWLEERAQLPIDPERGPAWRLSVVEFDDGTSALTIVISHYIVDGIGAVLATSLAVMGDNSGNGYPPPASRSTMRALIQDFAETIRDVPAIGRALAATAKEAQRRRRDTARPQRPHPSALSVSRANEPATMPGVWIKLNLDEWTACAEGLGGTSGALAAAITARFDQHLGRDHGDDPNATMLLLVNDRTEGDARAVAVSFAQLGIDPGRVTEDLRGVRAAIKTAMKTLRDTPDESAQFVALTPFASKRNWQQLIDYALSDPQHPAVCSHLGEVGPAVARPDGTLCSHAFIRGTSQHLTQGWLDRVGSQLQLFCGSGAEVNKVGIHVRAYEPGTLTTSEELRALAIRVLAEFGLVGGID